MRDLSRASAENSAASRQVRAAVFHNLEQSRPLRSILKDLIARLSAEQPASLRKDRR